MAGFAAAVTGFSVGAPARLQVEARRRWKGTMLNTKRRPKKVRRSGSTRVRQLPATGGGRRGWRGRAPRRASAALTLAGC